MRKFPNLSSRGTRAPGIACQRPPIMPRRNISRDLKARIPVLKGLGYCVKDICLLLGIKKTLVYDVLGYQHQYGTPYKPHTHTSMLGRHRTLDNNDLSFIRSMLQSRSMLYLDELQSLLLERRGTRVSIPTLSRTLHRLRISKKRVSARAIERNEQERAAYMNRIAELAPDPEMLMFTDESAKDERTSARVMGWSPIGDQCVSRRVFVRGKRMSILPLLTLDGIVTYDIIEGSVTADSFLKFVREMVVCRWSSQCNLSNFVKTDPLDKSLSRSS